MKKKIESNEKYKDILIAMIISIVHFTLSFFYDKLFFNYDYANEATIVMNVLFFIVLNIVWYKVIKIIKNIKEYKQKIIVFAVYFTLMMIMLVLTFPGIWRSDDSYMIVDAFIFKLTGWQHVFTSIFYLIALKFVPMQAGVIIIQNIIISAIISYLINDILENEKDKVKRILYTVILTLPFLLLPVIAHNLYALRLVLYSYVMLLSFYLTIKYYNEKSLMQFQEVKLALLFFILSTLRTEGIYYILIYIIVASIFVKKEMMKKTFAIISVIAIITAVFIVKKINVKYGGENEKYSITSTIEQITPLIIKADEDNDTEDLEKIDKVLKLDVILSNKDIRGIKLYYENYANVRETWKKEEYKDYMKTYYKLILKYPQIFIKERFEEYIRTNGLIPNETNNTYDTTCEEIERRILLFNDRPECGGNLINFDLRKKVIRILECRSQEDYMITNRISYPIFWNSIPPTIVIIATVIALLYKKKLFKAMILGSVLIKTVLVILTAPDSFFMYYLPEYLIGYSLLAYFIFKLCHKQRNKT